MEAVELQGFKELYEKLISLDAKLERKVWRKSLRAGAKVIQAEAKQRVPVAAFQTAGMKKRGQRPGDLKRSIKVRAGRARKGFSAISVLTGAKDSMFRGHTFYGGFVHFGTEKMPAREYLRDAFKAKQASILDQIKTALARELANV